MEDKYQNQNADSAYPVSVSDQAFSGPTVVSEPVYGSGALTGDPSSGIPVATVVVAEPTMQVIRRKIKPLLRWAIVVVPVVAVFLGIFFMLRSNSNQASQIASVSPAASFGSQVIPLDPVVIDGSQQVFDASTVTINGSLTTNGTLVITPSLQPSNPQSGQLYYDRNTNQLGYYNGEEFVFLGVTTPDAPDTLGVDDMVEAIAGMTGRIGLGTGLGSAGGQLQNTGVLSVQGQTGDVAFTGGTGISVNGTTITNTGVVSIVAGSPSLTVTNDGSGNYTITSSGGGSGTVASSGGTTGYIPVFTAAQTIENSILNQSGSVVTVAGDLNVTGNISLGSPLAVSEGGTGASLLAANGVLIGNGTSAITSLTTGVASLCLTSTISGPAWASCTSTTNAVQSLNSLTGGLTINNATGLVDTITIDDASTSAKGIAQFNGTNFSVAGGNVNTIQNISTGSSPTFNSLTLSGNLTVQGGTSTLGTLTQAGSLVLSDGSSHTVTVVADNLSANRVYTLPDAGGDATLCVTSGNCIGGGGSAPNTADYLVATLNGTLTNERALANGSNITLTDGGANSTLTVATVQNPTFTTSVTTPQLQSSGALVISSSSGNTVTIDAATTIELQDSTNVAGNLDVSLALNVGASDAFAVNSSGAITAATGITSSGTIIFSGLNCSVNANGGALTTNGSGQLMCSDDDGGAGGGISGGGTNGTIPVFNSTSSIANSIITQSGTTITVAGDLLLNTDLSVANGGTGASSFTSNGVLYGNATGALQVSAAGTSGQVLVADGSGVPTFVSFSGDVAVSNTGATTIQANSVALGTDTTGDYISNLGALTGLTTGGNSGEGSTPTLGVNYGSIANTAVQGNVTLTCPSGSGNLTGGGNSITLGAGGSCSGIGTVNNPTFTTSVTTPNLILTGSGSNGSIVVDSLGQGTIYTLPDPGQAAVDICLSVGNCAAAGTAGGDLTGTYPNPTIAKLQGANLTIAGPSAGNILVYNATNSAWENHTISGDVAINETGVATIASNAVALGTDTTGNYVLGLNAGNGINVTGSAGEGWSPTVAVVYGSSSNTAVQGNTGITVSAGTNLTGGGGITLGSGGTVTLNVTSSPVFTGTLAVQGATVTVGTASQQGSVVLNDGAGETGTIQIATLGQGVTYTLPDPGVGSVTICLTSGNCAGSGTGVTTAGGTTNRLSKFTGSQAIGDSLVSDDGTDVTVTGTGNFVVQGGTATLGTLSQAGTLSISDGSSNTVSIVASSFGADRTYTLPDVGGPATFCLSTGNCLGGGGGGAPNDAEYLLLSLNGTLTNERALAAGSNVSLTDGGAGSTLTVATVQNPTFTTSVTTPILQSSGALTISSGSTTVAIDAATTIELQDSTNVTGTLDVSVALNVGTTNAFQVSSGGAIAAATGVTSSGTIIFSGLDCTSNANGGALTTNGSGQLMCSDDNGAAASTITGSGTSGTIPLFNGTQTVTDSVITQSGSVVTITGSLSLTNDLSVANGGTGASSFTSNGVLYGNGSSAIQVTAAGTGGQVLVANGSGVPTFVSFSGDVAVSNTGATTIQANSVALGTDTTGDYVTNLGTLTGLSTTGNSGEGSTPALSVLYGSSSNTAVQGNTSITVSAGINLTGGGSITLGSGGTVTLNVASSPTFSGTLTVQGASATIGGSSQLGSLILNDGSSNTGTLRTAALGQDTIYTLPDPGGNASICLSTGNCSAVGSAGGDLTGTYPNPTIASLQSTTLTTSSVTSGNILQYNGSAWVNQSVSGDIVLSSSGVAAIQANSVALATDTTGDYVSVLGTLTGLSTTGNSGEGSTPTLSILYGSGSNTAVQGNTAITCPSGTGNLSGGGTSITLGSGGTCGNITITNSPTFSGTLTVNTIDPSSALTVGDVGQSFTLQGNSVSTITADDAGNTTTVGFATPSADTTINFPALSAGNYTLCTSSGNCAGAGVTLQSAYTNSSNPEIVVDATRGALTVRDASSPIGANLLEVQNNAASTTYFAVTSSGVQITGTNTSSGTINTTTGVVQTNSVTRLDNSGNLANIGSITNSGAVLHQNSVDSSTAFQIQNARGVLGLNVDTSTPNLITNSHFETNTTGWVALGSSSISRVTTDAYENVASLQIANTTTNDGARFAYSLASSTQYSLSLYIKRAPSGSFSTMEIGRSEDGSTNTLCATAQYATSANWSRITCTFTTGTVTGSPYIYVRQTDATARTVYVDAVQLETAASSTNYRNAKLTLSGNLAINSNTTLAGSTNTALYVQGNSGGDAVVIRGNGDNNVFQSALTVTNAEGTTVFNVNDTAKGVTAQGGSAFFNTSALLALSTASGARALDVKGASGQSVDIMQVKDNSDNVLLAVGAAGGLTVRTMTNSTTALQINDASNTAVLTADTTNSRVNIGTSDTTGSLLVLDTKTDIGDPTGVNGAMYYNATYGRFRCYQNSVWVDCVSSSPKEYLRARSAANQTTNVADNDHVKFDTVEASAGGSVSLDTITTYTSSSGASTGRFTLAAGKTYRLHASIPWIFYSSASGWAEYGWYNVTAGASIGTNGTMNPVTYSTGNYGNAPYAEAIITPAVSTIVEIRLIDTNNVTQIGSADMDPSAYIEVLSDGGGGGASAAEYMHAERPTIQNGTEVDANNDHINFTSVVASSGSSISLDTTTAYGTGSGASRGRFTLAAGKTYRLNANVPFTDFAGNAQGYFIYSWYNVTTGAEISPRAFMQSVTRSLYNYGSDGDASTIISPSVTTIVEVRTIDHSGVSGIGGSPYNPNVFIEVVSDGTKVAQLVGATAGTAGQGGFVGGAAAGQQGSVLLGDGTWSTGVTFINGAATFQNASDSTDAFRILDAGGSTALLTADTTTDTINIGWRLGVADTITNGGFDFVLGTTDQVSRGSCGLCRALVKNTGSILTLNYLGDFTGGTVLGGPGLGIGITPTSKLHIYEGTTGGASLAMFRDNPRTAAMEILATAGDTSLLRSGSADTLNFAANNSATAHLSIDTSGNVLVGTSDTTGALFVLDTKTGSGDPTGTNGGMYYNSNSSKFRCYEASEWRDCVSSIVTNGIGNALNSGNTSSGSYGNVPTTSSFAFTKKAASTKLVFSADLSAYATSGTPRLDVAVRIDSTDYACGTFFFNVNNEHHQLSCEVIVSGITAGSKTAQFRWKIGTSGTVNVDNNDWLSFTVQETF